MNKYNIYQKDYKEYLMEQNKDVINKGPPILYDAILSGCSCPFVNHHKEDDLKDIREIITLCPESVLYDQGIARCRNNVTPLWAAYNNDNELLSNENRKEIISLLLNNGATNEDTIVLNCKRVKVIDDIK